MSAKRCVMRLVGMTALMTCWLVPAGGCMSPCCRPNPKQPTATAPQGRIVPALTNACGLPVYLFGDTSSGSPIILLHELKGPTSLTLEFAAELSTRHAVYVPVMFGKTNEDCIVAGMCAAMFDGDWRVEAALGGSRPVTQRLKALSFAVSALHTNEPLGVVGMCLTGTLPLALLDNSSINAVVVAQPRLPFFGGEHPGGQNLGISFEEERLAAARIAATNVIVLGLRFERDELAPRWRHIYMARRFGGGFLNGELPAACYSRTNASGALVYQLADDAHSTLVGGWPGTEADPRHPVLQMRAGVMRFFDNPRAYAESVRWGQDIPWLHADD